MNPLVSIICLAYNHENFIVEALESVCSQDYRNFELIICNDCSEDLTLERIQSFLKSAEVSQGLTNISLIDNKRNLGTWANLKKGFLASRGAFIVFAHGDDVSSRTRVNDTLNCFYETNADAIAGAYSCIDDKGLITEDLYSPDYSSNFLWDFLKPKYESFLGGATCAVTREFMLEAIREIDSIKIENKVLNEDMLLTLFAVAHNKKVFQLNHKPLINYRVIPTSVSNFHFNRYNSSAEYLLSWLAREERMAASNREVLRYLRFLDESVAFHSDHFLLDGARAKVMRLILRLDIIVSASSIRLNSRLRAIRLCVLYTHLAMLPKVIAKIPGRRVYVTLLQLRSFIYRATHYL